MSSRCPAAVHFPDEEQEEEEIAIRRHAGRKIPRESEASQTRFRALHPALVLSLSVYILPFALDGPRHVGLNFGNFNFRLFLSELLGYNFACAIKQRPRNHGLANLVSTGYHGGCLFDKQPPADTSVTLIEFALVPQPPCYILFDNAHIK